VSGRLLLSHHAEGGSAFTLTENCRKERVERIRNGLGMQLHAFLDLFKRRGVLLLRHKMRRVSFRSAEAGRNQERQSPKKGQERIDSLALVIVVAMALTSGQWATQIVQSVKFRRHG